jgi:short-subunit dehydrogenase
MRQPQTVFITGASSGLGAALARRYAAPGMRLSLTGRNRERLEAVAEECRSRGAEADIWLTDVADRDAIAGTVLRADRMAALDLVIANAGVSAGTLGGPETAEQVRRILAINVDGVVNTVQPAIDCMKPRGRGQIAIVSSLAAFRGFPGAPAYCASKAAIKVWAEALRGNLHHLGITVSVICPGYVETPMTAANDFWMPMMMKPERAADIVVRGLARNRPRIAFPWPLYAAVTLVGLLPPVLIDPLMRKLPAKGGTIED